MRARHQHLQRKDLHSNLDLVLHPLPRHFHGRSLLVLRLTFPSRSIPICPPTLRAHIRSGKARAVQKGEEETGECFLKQLGFIKKLFGHICAGEVQCRSNT